MIHAGADNLDDTSTRLIKAMDAQHPVTITYLKEETDSTGRPVYTIDETTGKKTRRLIETVRTIEIYDMSVSIPGNRLIKAMDRQTGERRDIRLDRITAYTVHRTAYTVECPVRTPDKDRTSPTLCFPGLAPALPDTADIETRINQLADLLAA
jgi:hypothetical protein